VTRLAYVSAAIATLDRPEALARCLDALLSGIVLPAEVVVVDQSTNDATKAVIEPRQAGAVPIIYIRQQRRGLSASRNAALAQVSYPVVAVTDDDCVPDPGWVAAIERAFASPAAPHALGGRVLPLGPEVPGTYVIAVRESPLRAEFSGKALPWLVGSGNNFAVKTDWFSRIGGCDERLGVGSPGKAAEDIDLFYRLLRAGAHVRYEPEALVYHQRQTKTQRLRSRYGYGYGVGAFCSLCLRRGDLYALRVFAHWLCWQCKDLAVATGRWQLQEAHQRWLALRGTVSGLIYGLRVKESVRSA
jgi:GT2 family glycosyltransferase